MELKTILNFNRQDFEEIYFKENQGSLFFSPLTRAKTATSFILGIILLFTYSNSSLTSSNWGFFYVFLLIFILSAVHLLLNVHQVLKWKQSVIKYLNVISKFTSHELLVNDSYLALIQDGNETIVRWSEFKKVELGEDFIRIEGSIDFLFPRKSMSESNFLILKELIRNNIK